MGNLSEQRDCYKRRTEAALERDGFRRVRAELVWEYFIEHSTAHLNPWSLATMAWEKFRRDQLSHLSDVMIERALKDLEGLRLVEISHESRYIIVHRTTAGAQACAA